MGKGCINNERTPLIQQSEGTGTTIPPTVAVKTYKKTYHIYGITLGFLFVFSFIINWYRTILPQPLSDIEARAKDDFSGIHAYNEYLSHFTAPHSANMRENGVMRDFLTSVAYGFQKEATAKGLKMDVIGYDTSSVYSEEWIRPSEHYFSVSRNVIVRLNGTAGRDEALLINAHYDSVPTSYGVTDNGMGVVTTVELIRYFIEHPPRHTIIFLLNNLEEVGLIGAKAFVEHPWYSSVKLFINLEGAGAGGRAIMFRCSNLDLAKKIAYSKAGFKHSSPLGNDMFKVQLIKSTDYSVFTQNGVPGVDIAFYAPRSHYHTARDDLAHTSPEALQYMGQITLAAVRSIANTDDILGATSEQETLVYYDILGRFMFAYSFTVYQVINVMALSIVPVVALYLTVASFYNKKNNTQCTIFDLLKQRVFFTGYGLICIFSTFFVTVVVILVSVYIMSKMNPSMTYGDVHGAALYIFTAAFLGLQLSQLILPNKLKQSLSTTDATWYGLITFWWIFTLIASIAGTKRIAGLYFAVYLLTFNSLAAFLHVIIAADKKFRSPVIFFTQILLPFVLLMELELLIMDAMRHATADGTPEIAIYILMAIPLILIVMHFLPWVYVAGNNRQTTLITAIIFLFLFTICSSLQPFNGGWSPNKLSFRQSYITGDSLATVSITAGTAGVQSALKSALPAQELKTLGCTKSGFINTCTYQTELVPKYGSNETLNEFIISEVFKVCDANTCTSSVSYSAKNSIMCKVYFDPEENNNQVIQHVWVNGNELKADNITSLVTYIDKYQDEVNFTVKYPVTADDEWKSRKAQVGCFYDEWTQLEIPAFTSLRDNLPESTILLIRGQGLAYVNYKNITL